MFENTYFQITELKREKLLRLSDKYGTPLYVYDYQIINSQFKRLVKAFSGINLKLFYACKANNNPHILKHLLKLGSGLDCVSINEVKLGLKVGYKPQEIIFTPNNVSIDEILEAADLGVRINIDAISVLEQFGQLLPDYPICIRINPHIMAGGNTNISVGHIDSKFGISIHQMPHLQKVLKLTGQNISGLHMHTGSDILDIEVFIQAADLLYDIAKQFDNLSYIDFGSGFKVPYYPKDYGTDIETLGKRITERHREFCHQINKNIELCFEPGKFLVSHAGYFLTKVNIIKNTTSSVFIGVDSGFNHLIRPMFYGAYHHIVNLTNPKGKPRFYNITGNLCETDTFATNRIVSEAREGDILCFLNAGAYCFSMASHYNLRPKPAEVILTGKEGKLIRRRETLEDLLMTLIE